MPVDEKVLEARVKAVKDLYAEYAGKLGEDAKKRKQLGSEKTEKPKRRASDDDPVKSSLRDVARIYSDQEAVANDDSVISEVSRIPKPDVAKSRGRQRRARNLARSRALSQRKPYSSQEE